MTKSPRYESDQGCARDRHTSEGSRLTGPTAKEGGFGEAAVTGHVGVRGARVASAQAFARQQPCNFCSAPNRQSLQQQQNSNIDDYHPFRQTLPSSGNYTANNGS